jgi:hypothetical protein
MKTALFAAVISAILTTACPGEDKTQKTDPNQPTVQQLLKKFAESRQNMNSFIIDVKMEDIFKVSEKNNFNWGGKGYSTICNKYDGNRNKTILNRWGYVNPQEQNLSESDADYNSWLWDGENRYEYLTGKSFYPGQVIIVSKKEFDDPKNYYNYKGNNYIKSASTPAEIMGYHSNDGVRIDELLKNNSGQVKLREKSEKVNGADCFVIDAVVKGKGKYTVWIDPVHDYHIAKIHVQRRKNDYIGRNKLGEKDYSNETFKVVKFERVGDAWFPKQCREHLETFGYGTLSIDDRDIQITSCLFNPDHEALKSFVPDDIANGASVLFTDLPPPSSHTKQKFTWRDGKVIDKDGKVIMDCTAKKQDKSNESKQGK